MRLAVSLVFALMAPGVLAQEGAEGSDDSGGDVVDVEAFDSEPERCVRTNRIRRTKVIDDRTIAFYMRNRDVYVNTLDNRCPQLATEERFAYTARQGQLCDTDVITVLLQFGGRFEPGFTCRLGEFVPTNAETIELMIEAVESGGVARPYTAEPVELPPEHAADTEADTADAAPQSVED